MGSKSYSKGISWIDDCRIPFVDEDKPTGGFGGARIGYGNEYEYDGVCGEANTQGRFPANILVSDDMLNDGSIGQNNSKNKEWGLNDDFKVNEYLVGLKKTGISRIADKGTNSRYYDIDKWFDKILE